MEISGPKSLNSSVTNLWTNHRRRLNLNAVPSIDLLPAPTITDAVAGPSTPSISDVQIPPVPDSADGASAAQPILIPPDEPPTPNGIRKRKPPASSKTPSSKRAKADSSSVPDARAPPTARLSDLGGVEQHVDKLLKSIGRPLRFPELYLRLGTKPPRGVLLHGPPGCGKTLLAHAIAGELGVPFISVSAPSIVSGTSGESEKALREYFDEAKTLAPCILFFDEIDAITPKRETTQRAMEQRIVAQLLTCMDELSWDKLDNRPVVFIGATNRPDALDPALRRAGRFDVEIGMGVPDEDAREQILRVLSSKLTLSGDVDFRLLAKLTPGYVGADLDALTTAAGELAADRVFADLLASPPSQDPDADVSMQDADQPVDTPDTASSMTPFASLFFRIPHPLPAAQLSSLQILPSDFLSALPSIQPSTTREGFAAPSSVTWRDVGALHTTRRELHMAIVQPIRRPALFRRMGIRGAKGVLLWGPPGCGKTLLAKAVASESRANFMSVKGPELLNKYVGESERAVRQVFSRARASAPCVIFFDELDALVPRRTDRLSEASSGVVNTVLTELDGLATRGAVYIIGATNRPDMVDPALLRPGRFDKLLYVDLPTADERAEIVHTICERDKVPLREGEQAQVEEAVRARGDGMSGADLAAVVSEAAVLALRDTLGAFEHDSGDDYNHDPNANTNTDKEDEHRDVWVTAAHFEAALGRVTPSVNAQQRRRYELLRRKFADVEVRGKVVLDPEEADTEAEAGGRIEEVVAEEGQGRGTSGEGVGEDAMDGLGVGQA